MEEIKQLVMTGVSPPVLERWQIAVAQWHLLIKQCEHVKGFRARPGATSPLRDTFQQNGRQTKVPMH